MILVTHDIDYYPCFYCVNHWFQLLLTNTFESNLG